MTARITGRGDEGVDFEPFRDGVVLRNTGLWVGFAGGIGYWNDGVLLANGAFSLGVDFFGGGSWLA